MPFKYTNKDNISLPLAVWLMHDSYDYDKRENVISATSLLKPTRALTTSGLWESSITPTIASTPLKTLGWFTLEISCLSEITTTFGLCSKICWFRSFIFFPHTKASTCRLNLCAIMRAFTPIEPVEPKTINYTSPRSKTSITIEPKI